MTPRQKIAAIDKRIDAVVRELKRCEPNIDPMSYIDWGEAWTKHPDLDARHRELYRQRGQAQRERDRAESVAIIRRARHSKPKPPKVCPTCKHRTLYT